MATVHAPRSASVLLSDALRYLDLIEPPAAREPIRGMLRAAIEECAISNSLLGKRINYVLELAEALVAASRENSAP
ncbi:hypothetical protein GCM10022254_10160 [Actinomadura meridiana]|uniref:Uncharacterized protein n=1 Tax=Actinomadura meridiana TaxID=559626 RepID=A0ABP8BTW4_9ACTN